MARLSIRGNHIEVRLSRRNLLALMHMLDVAPGRRGILAHDCYQDGLPVRHLSMLLVPEEDEEHYAGRDVPPGPMRPDAEDFIRGHPR